MWNIITKDIIDLMSAINERVTTTMDLQYSPTLLSVDFSTQDKSKDIYPHHIGPKSYHHDV